MSPATPFPSSGPSKTYAQAVKEPPPPQTEPPLLQDIVITPHDDDWTDVSSVTSCAWPGSPKTESIASNDSCLPTLHTKGGESTALGVVAEAMENTPWIDEDTDTRVPHAFAGQIKHTNRSRWRYTNIHPHPDHCYSMGDQEPPKPWRPFPGCRGKFWHRIHYRIKLNMAAEQRDVREELKEVKKSLKSNARL